MAKRGQLNLITDIAGLMVGNAEDEGVRTGVTVRPFVRRVRCAQGRRELVDD